MSKQKSVQAGNAFLPDPKKRKSLDTNRAAYIKFEDAKEKKAVYHRLPKEGVFKQYEELEVVAANIAKEFLLSQVFQPVDLSAASYQSLIENGATFFMSPEQGQKRSGLVSICPALLTAIKLYGALSESSELKPKLFANINTGIEAVFKLIFRGDEQPLSDDAPVFDASPYEYESFTKGMNGKSYVDSISWVVPLALRIINLTVKKGKTEAFVFSESMRSKCRFLARWCLRYINNCLLSDAKGKPIGWSFTKLDKPEGAERSLYFSYAASTVYLSFYAEYERFIEAFKVLDNACAHLEDDYEDISLTLSEKYWKNKNGELQKNLAFIMPILERKLKQSEEISKSSDTTALDEEIKRLTEIKEAIELLLEPENADEIELLAEFNDECRITNDMQTAAETPEKIGALARLKWNLLQISENIWQRAGDKLEENFLYEDADMTVAEKPGVGGQTNALFTGLLQIGIMLNCAFDIRVRQEKGAKEYEKMQDTMFLHVQKTQRYFDKLDDEGKAFGVDSLILRFMEKINEGTGSGISDRALAEKLRKASIRVCSLTPLLLKTNNLLSEYVVQYPQKQMGQSLTLISERRFVDKESGQPRWIWERDSYHAVSNYYYVSAIFDFYAYYKKYEQAYVKRYDTMRQDLLSDLDFSEGVRRHYQKITEEKSELRAEYEAKLAAKEDEIAGALAKVKRSETADKLVDDIMQVIKDSSYFESPEFFNRLIGGLRTQLARELAEKYLKNPNEDRAVIEKISRPLQPKDESLLSLIQAFLADIILPSAIDAKKREGMGAINGLGKQGLEGIMPADFALRGGKQLIEGGLIEKVLMFMFSSLVWQDQKK